MYLPLDILFAYWIEHGLLYATFRFSTKISCREVSGFAGNWPCGVSVPWIKYLPPISWSTLWKHRLKWEWICNVDIMDNFFIVFNHVCMSAFAYTLMSHNMVIPYTYSPYFHISNNDLFAYYARTLLLHRHSLHAFNCIYVFGQFRWMTSFHKDISGNHSSFTHLFLDFVFCTYIGHFAEIIQYPMLYGIPAVFDWYWRIIIWCN